MVLKSPINQECSQLLHRFFLALSWACLSLHIISSIAYHLYNTVSVFRNTYFIVTENHDKAHIGLFTTAEANAQHPAAGYGEFAGTVWYLHSNRFVWERKCGAVCVQCVNGYEGLYRANKHVARHITHGKQAHSCTDNGTQTAVCCSWRPISFV